LHAEPGDVEQGPLRLVTRSQRSAAASVALGAIAVSTSAIFIDLANTSPLTSSFWRCLLAAPLVAVLARWERLRPEDRTSPRRRLFAAVLCGALFAGDMVWWAQAIDEVGAGLSTVLVNAQVVIVPLLAWVLEHEPPNRRYFLALPALLVGVVLAGGLADGGGAGSQAALGTIHASLAAISYSGFLFLLRRLGSGSPVRSYRDALLTAAAVTAGVAALGRELPLDPGWHAFGWLALVALLGQAPGWLLVAVGSPRLAPSYAATLLLLTPLGALVLSGIFLDQVPTALQGIGCVLVLVGVLIQSRGPGRNR
jgi:drug/metabolite transporter (DMT)-like permease